MTGLLVCAPLGIEARALRRSLPTTAVLRTGYGPRRSERSTATLRTREFDALAVAGLGGAVTDRVATGNVVVASEVRGPDGTVTCPSAPLLAGELRRAGFTVHCGPIASHDHIVRPAEHAALARSDVLAVDMESATLAAAAGTRPLAVVRVAVDTPADPLAHRGTPLRALRALRTLGRIGPALQRWAEHRPTTESTRFTLPEEVS